MTTPAVSKPADKGVTSNTSHTAPGSSPASPLSSRSSPPHSQVVTRRTPDFPGASGHSTHCCAGHRVRHCNRTVAAVVAAAAVVEVGKWKTTCKVLLSVLSVFPCSHFSLSPPCDLSCVAHFLRGSDGCSPHSSTVSCRPQVWSVVNSDPPCVVPPCHVSVRHVALFLQ